MMKVEDEGEVFFVMVYWIDKFKNDFYIFYLLVRVYIVDEIIGNYFYKQYM